MTLRASIGALALGAALSLPCGAYPLDGYGYTGIARLEGYRLAQLGAIRPRHQPPGALLNTDQVMPRLLDYPQLDLPAPDPQLTARIGALLGAEADRYGVAVLDLSDPKNPVYAEHNGRQRHNPGSVGKILVALGVFQALADLYPDDIAARERILRETPVVADEFIVHDHHVVPFWDPQARRLSHRRLREGDRASLWTYLDWMCSASSNAAASMVIQQLLLLVHYGHAYPVDQDEVRRFFRETPRAELQALLERALQQPVTRNGLDLGRLRQGSLFTQTGQRRVPGTNSYADARELLRYALLLEQGRLVDRFSSREIKRLLYLTQRRIRYASSPALAGAAVYFKSGSLYRCKPEEGFVCRQYQGNRENRMNSLAIIEAPAEGRRLYYLVAVMSNVLRRNSAVDHQTLATRIHRLIESRHAAPSSAPAPPPAAESSQGSDRPGTR